VNVQMDIKFDAVTFLVGINTVEFLDESKNFHKMFVFAWVLEIFQSL